MSEVSRRSFLKHSGMAAGAAAGLLIGTSKTSWAGANERVRVAVLGINGRGKEHLSCYAKTANTEVTTLCDPDARLFAPRIKDFFTDKQKSEPKTEQDLRRVLEDKDIDVISIATPNHWHSLATIWACQAGKDVYVEKPMTHNIFEGRQVVAAAEKYQRIVQHGVQLRSNPGFQRGIQKLKDGVIGDVYMARCVCYKWRPDVGKAHVADPPKELNWDVWQGPAQAEPYYANEKGEGAHAHYYWHWKWAYGNGDIGNQGVHQLDAARWGLGVEVPYRVTSMGGLLLWHDYKEVFDVSSTSYMFKDKATGKDKMLTLEVRPWYSNDEAGGSSFGVLFYGTKGYMSFPEYEGYKLFLEGKLTEEDMEGSTVNHFQNFLDCVRDRKAENITSKAIDGHYSSALSHYALTGARVNRVLEIDTEKEMVKNDDEANSHLTRVYREPYAVPVEV
ncbi:MAG: Gfo/Idh/MocA family oxidoreductase [Candidatus Hydrogenedentes bacterium]|nr:Gfo/Idh/MocA family oxidoreductase [Candidatus Hydrogenedentota bacterium]